MQWRAWSIPVKLSAVTLVPIVIALILGAITIRNQVDRSDTYQRIDRLVTLSADARSLIDGLQRERTQTTALLSQGTASGSPELDATRGVVDRAVAQLNTAAKKAVEFDGSIAGPSKEASDQLARLRGLREQVSGGQLEPVQSITEYTAVTTALLKLDTALAAGIGDDAIGGTPSALHDLQVAKEELSLGQALVSYGITRGTLAPTELNQLRTAEIRLADRLADFRAAATQAQRQDFDSTVAGPNFQTRDGLVRTALGEKSAKTNPIRDVNAQQWTDSSGAVISRVNDVSSRLGDQIGNASAKLVEDSSSGAGLLAVLLFGALVLAAAVVFLITRQLLRSLRVLRASALDVAERQLPAAVQNIQEGREQSTDVQPVPVENGDEIGEVARAFDAVHSQALRLAVEQAAMRTGYGAVFVNLSRRSQSLVQRQLQMIERLERDEEDADQLATLFQLDHLATRMRRNNENLMVLSGAEPGRRSSAPVTTTDVLRAAVSEIEQYQRVVVQPPPEARIVGYAASDLMRLIAELLDNATAFSAPETRVTVATRFVDGGALVVDIMDKGIGMNEAEVADANARLTEAATVDLATSRRMGLFVVGRLASRHHIGVALHGGKDITGVRATVTVPADLVMDGPSQATPQAQSPQVDVPAQPSGALPRRQRTANGASRAGALQNLTGGVPVQAGSPEARSANGAGAQAPRPPSDLEISGTALFSPIDKDTPADPEPAAPPEPPPAPEPREEPSADGLPSGKALFAANDETALSDWWSEAATTAGETAQAEEELRASRAETTPIFDETLSAWFRAVEPPAPAAEEKAGAEQPGEEPATSWAFAADESWKTVQAISQTEPSSFTQAGLPRRRRGEQLLPGSATPAEKPSTDTPAERSELPVRDPADVRGRLSSFQQGVHRGRQASGKPRQQPEEAAQPQSPAQPQPQSPAAHQAPAPQQPQQQAPAAPQAQPPAAPPQQQPPQSQQAAPQPQPPAAAEPPAAQAPPPAQQPLPQRRPSPLPSRRPKTQPRAEQPQPQPQAHAEQPPQPQAEEPQQADWPQAPVEWPKPEDETLARQAAAKQAETENANESTAAWSFASDDGWRTVKTVSQAAPSGYTAAGLPRRRRGEQLMPGSAAPASAAAVPRTERDPNDVRGRLSSFQQGIRRGRHRTAQPSEGNQETMEGE